MDTQLFTINPPAHKAKHWLAAALHTLIVLSVVAGFGALRWATALPEHTDEQQTIVVGPTRFAPDSNGSVRVVVQDFFTGKPIANASVKVSLKPASGQTILLFEGQTGETGSLPVSFYVPDDVSADAQLVVETDSDVGHDRVAQGVTIQREYRLLLSTDKPLYQPGQTIHMRALALSTFDLTPARGATVNFLVQDAKGNKVFRHSVTASDFGVAAADFVLADMVNQGNYRLSVAIGDTVSERTVEVRPYALPKFGVNVSTERSFYLPGQRVEGVVQADYFFGKPVAEGQVQIVGSVWDVERVVIVDLLGQTDENGTYEFGFDLPEYFAGSGLDAGQGQFALEVTVIDQTEHPEQVSQVLPVAAQPLLIEAVAESGTLRRGVENVVYVLTSYPDGRPAPARLRIRVDGGEVVELDSGEFGLTEFTLTPQADGHVLDIVAQDETGLSASHQVIFKSESGSDSVLLRADRAAYVVGETMNLAAFTPVESGSIYLDIVKDGQTISTRSARVQGGKAEFAVDVSPDLYGALELHAYKVLLDGTIARDTRLVVVDAPNDVAIAVSANKKTYLPGEMAVLDFQTGDTAQGGGIQTALGVAIVDESVFALQRQYPGFAKLYFMLEQELMEPFYQIDGFELPAASRDEDTEPVRSAQDTAAAATWAGTPATVPNLTNTRLEKVISANPKRASGFKRIGQAAAAGMTLIPLTLCGVVVTALWRDKVIRQAFERLIGTLGRFWMGGGVLACVFLYLNISNQGVMGAVVSIASGLGMLAFVVYAWQKRDPAAKSIVVLTLAWVGLLFLLVRTMGLSDTLPDALVLVIAFAYLLIPGAYLLFGQGRWLQARRFGGAASTAIGALSMLSTLVIVMVVRGFIPGYDFLSPQVTWEQIEVTREVEVEGEAMVEVVFEAEPTPAPEAPSEQEPAADGEAPRLRQYFPETLYWNPEALTDEGGFVSLEIPMADSITTWRLTALASSQDGRLGFTTRGVRVFQDFFVDVDLPVSLTQGDEISIPVGVFNYLPDAQEVRLVVEPESWFELLDPDLAEQTLTIGSNDIEVVYFPIHVLKFGRRGFQVTAWGEHKSDAIRREVNVVPDGKEFRFSESDWLRGDEEFDAGIPPEAVPDTGYVEVKIYPGVMSQVVEGLQKILRLPNG
ncbi:MAG: hypothetical protein GY835_16310 [bacterium]|nr:hypothetical protein [bacterium]